MRSPDPAEVRQTYLDVVGRCLHGFHDVAHVDFPNHSNVGDSAIWLGECVAFRRLGKRVRYRCDIDSYDARALRSRLPAGPILIHGGGNFGDLYPRHQDFRERLIEDFPDRIVIQLPQTVHFGDRRSLGRAKAKFEVAKEFTLLVRDRESCNVAEALGVRSILCPDAVHLLDRIERPRATDREIVWLARTDDEADGDMAPPVGVEPVDWLDPSDTPAVERVSQWLRRRARDHPRERRWIGAVQARGLESLARRRLTRGVALLARGRVVVTDRLHGHLLAMTLGIPSVVLDTRHGKLSRYVDAWTKDHAGVYRAGSAAEAWEIASRVAALDTGQVS